jgi:hypothetical protein
MKRFIEGGDRGQGTLLPEHLDDYVAEDNPARIVDVFVDELDLAGLGFERVRPAKTGRQAYHPSVLLKLYIYGYSKFKAVNSSDRNFTDAKLKRRMEEIESNISRYLAELETADRQEPGAPQSRSGRLNEKIAALKSQMATLKEIEAKLKETGETEKPRRHATLYRTPKLALPRTGNS